ncbi:hypothetical protein Plim_2749 [Planctopirus limnophila DSM 3776]|uniref:Uncharacterized protein n=1 Tax=Planctopirus limnophila (strain ATCC 43296 / DSM 3776 / IFAM 1008 / Mu 290) TaxID=521674 RepID=D5SR79_PLAL2|nr:hypothetical protein Plim_2749 [Planctopirus limnophila DSM 3776]
MGGLWRLGSLSSAGCESILTGERSLLRPVRELVLGQGQVPKSGRGSRSWSYDTVVV